MSQIMLFEDLAGQVSSESFASMITQERRAELAKIGKAWDFYYGNQAQYIKHYRGEDAQDYEDKDKITINYTKTIIDEYVGGVFAKPVAVAIDDPTYSEIWRDIADPISFFKVLPFMTKVQRIAEVSGTCVVMIRFNEATKSVYFEDVRGEYVHFLPDPNNPKEVGTLILAYLFDTGNPRPSERYLKRIEVWDKDKWAIYLYHPHLQEMKVVDEGVNPYGFIPAVKYVPEEDDNSFFGMTNVHGIVHLNEEYNNLWTSLMRTSVMQSFSVLIVTSEGEIKLDIAPTRFIKLEQTDDAKAEYITPQPKIAEVKGVLEQLKKELQDVSRVPAEVLSSATGSGAPYQSGYALRVKRIPIEEIWNRRRLSYGPSYRNMVFKTLSINDVHNKKTPPKSVVDIGIDVKFSSTVPEHSPNEQVVQDEFELRYDVITPIDLIIRKYPDMSTEEAKKKLEANQAYKKEFTKDQFSYNIDDTADKSNLVGTA